MEATAKRSHKKLVIILIIVAAILCAPFVPALVCEIRTARHLGEFTPVINDYDKFTSDGWKFKVLEYSDESAKIYRYSMEEGHDWGETQQFIKENGEWKTENEEWECGWNFKANQYVPQYWWHVF